MTKNETGHDQATAATSRSSSCGSFLLGKFCAAAWLSQGTTGMECTAYMTLPPRPHHVLLDLLQPPDVVQAHVNGARVEHLAGQQLRQQTANGRDRSECAWQRVEHEEVKQQSDTCRSKLQQGSHYLSMLCAEPASCDMVAATFPPLLHVACCFTAAPPSLLPPSQVIVTCRSSSGAQTNARMCCGC